MRTNYYQSAQISLEILGRWINHLPFWVTEATLTIFETQQAEFKRLQQSPSTHSLLPIKALRDLLFTVVDSLLSASLNSLHPDHQELFEALNELKKNYKRQTVADEGLGVGDTKIEAKTVDISSDLVHLIGQIQGYQERLLKTSRLNALKSNGSVHRRLEAKSFQHAKQIQHEIFVSTRALEDFDQLIEEKKIAIPDEDQWLEIKHYADLILLSYLLKPTAVETALRCKHYCLEKTRQLFNQRKSALMTSLGSRFHDIVHWQRRILVYTQWQRHLQTTLPHHVANLSPLQRRMTLRDHIHYQKRPFFKEHFNQQKSFLIINMMYRQWQVSPTIPQLEADLLQEEHRLQQQMAAAEKRLLSGMGVTQSLFANCALAVTRQPAFQYGQLAARAALHELDLHPNWPILGVKLPPAMAQQVEQINGLCFLTISIGLTSWLGSSYELVSTLNHLLWANYRVLDHIGRSIEQAAHYTITPTFSNIEQKASQPLGRFLIRLKNHLRLDEQGLAEKEAALNWLTRLMTHLGLSVGLSGQSLPASVAGYSLGTACASSASWTVEQIMQQYDQDPERIQITKTLIYLTVYSLAYHQGYVLAHQHLGIGYNHLSDTQALQRFGLTSEASERQVRKRYHQLSLENHVDKCKTPACAEKWADITEAYQVLMKKRA